MAKRSDDSENFIIEGTLTVINHPTNGAGNIEVGNILYTDVIRSNTISGVPVDINEVQFLEKAMTLDEYSGSPSAPSSGKYSFYIENGLLKSKNSTSTVTTYQPTTTKGDILTHDGTTQVRLPAGIDGRILLADSTATEGIKWDTLAHSALTGLLNDDHTQYALLAGRTGGQILTGGTASGNNLVLRSTSNATKGSIVLDETTASTSTTSGSLIIAGSIAISNTTDAVSVTNGGTFTTGGGMAIGKTVYVGENILTGQTSINGGRFVTISNTSNGSNAFSIFAALNNSGNGLAMFINSSTRTADGGVNTATVRNDIGSLRLQSQGALGITIAASTGIVSINNTTATTSSTTGSLLLPGGIGISNTTDAVSSTNGGTITTAGGIAIAKKAFIGTDISIGGTSLFNNYFQTVNITAPSAPPASNIRFYTDSADSLLKSKDSGGIITTYQPTTVKGDLLTHNGTTQIRLPVGVNGYILTSDSTTASGLSWEKPSLDYRFSWTSITFNANTYTLLFRFTYRGTNSIQPFTSANVITIKAAGGHTYDLRLFDITNNLQIAQITGQNNTTVQTINISPVSNVPATPAIIELQGRRVGGVLGGITTVNFLELVE